MTTTNPCYLVESVCPDPRTTTTTTAEVVEHSPCYPNCVTNEVAENGIPQAVSGTVQQQNPSTLPFTGGDIMGLTAIGIGCILAGTLLKRRKSIV